MAFRQAEGLKMIQMNTAVFNKLWEFLSKEDIGDYKKTSVKDEKKTILPYHEFVKNDGSVVLRFHKATLGTEAITSLDAIFPIPLGYGMYVRQGDVLVAERFFKKFSKLGKDATIEQSLLRLL